jgi:hypothetical protein
MLAEISILAGIDRNSRNWPKRAGIFPRWNKGVYRFDLHTRTRFSGRSDWNGTAFTTMIFPHFFLISNFLREPNQISYQSLIEPIGPI